MVLEGYRTKALHEVKDRSPAIWVLVLQDGTTVKPLSLLLATCMSLLCLFRRLVLILMKFDNRIPHIRIRDHILIVKLFLMFQFRLVIGNVLMLLVQRWCGVFNLLFNG